ncbi:MAG: efflux RND transporter periplasmic adaptor subunit [Endomicrobium sp.]|jgi:HlyD family secretion protein|nr:efflux RND transporter periplasmic adaptor subunit [Endomicrobium sp.]
MKKKIIILAISLIALLIIALLFFRHQPFAYSGVVEAIEIDISSKISDNITKFYVKEGDRVVKGQVLLELEGQDILRSYNFARSEYERIKKIYNRNAVSKEIYDFKKYLYDDAEIKKNYLIIKSPIDGTVLYKYYNEGEMVTVGRKILTVADLKEMDVWVYLPHNAIASINVGEKVSGFLSEINKEFMGFICSINDTAEFTPKNVQTKNERERLVYGVKIRFKNDENLTLKPGMTLEIKFKN